MLNFFLFFNLFINLINSQEYNATVYDWTYGNLALWHSESSYCDPSSYLTRTYKGVLEGFIPTYAIYDKSHGIKIDLLLFIYFYFV